MNAFFAYISPLARASIHLSIRDRFLLFLSNVMVLVVYSWRVPGVPIFLPLFVLLFVAAYSSLIGSLSNERRRAERLIGLSEFEGQSNAGIAKALFLA